MTGYENWFGQPQYSCTGGGTVTFSLFSLFEGNSLSSFVQLSDPVYTSFRRLTNPHLSMLHHNHSPRILH